MTKQTQTHPQKPEQTHPSANKKELERQNEEVEQQKQKAKEDEVAGRHKNEGRNDYAGHKTSR